MSHNQNQMSRTKTKTLGKQAYRSALVNETVL